MVVQPEGNFYDKYHASNPVVRKIMQGFWGAFDRCLRDAVKPGSILEAGCGEGELLRHLIDIMGEKIVYSGFDISESCIAKAKLLCPEANLNVTYISEFSGGGRPHCVLRGVGASAGTGECYIQLKATCREKYFIKHSA